MEDVVHFKNYALLALFSILKQYLCIAKSLWTTEMCKEENTNHLIQSWEKNKFFYC